MTSSRYFGVDGTPIRVTGMSDTVNRTPAFEEAVDITVATYAVGGPYVANGTVDMLWRNTAVQLLMASMLGATNVFTDTPATCSIDIGDEAGNYMTQYTPAVFSSCELTLNVRDFVRTRWTWLASKGTDTQAGATGSSAPADQAAVFYNATIKVGNSAIDCKTATLRIDRKFDTDYFYIGSPWLQGFYQNGQTELGGTLTLGAGQYTELAYVISGGTSAHIITECNNELKQAALEITLKDKDCNPLAVITCGYIVFSEMSRSVTGRNLWDKSINYRVVLPANSDFEIVYS